MEKRKDLSMIHGEGMVGNFEDLIERSNCSVSPPFFSYLCIFSLYYPRKEREREKGLS